MIYLKKGYRLFAVWRKSEEPDRYIKADICKDLYIRSFG